MRRVLAHLAPLLFPYLTACPPRSGPETELVPEPVVQTSTASPWAVVRRGRSPLFSANGGRATVAIEAAYDPEIRRLPGVTLGSDRGTRAAYLGGFVAPLIAPPRSDGAYRATLEAEGSAVEIRLADAFDLAVGTGTSGRARLSATGRYFVLLAGDRAEVRTTVRGAPTAAFQVEADAPPGVRALRADRIEIRSPKAGVVVVETSCPRPKIVTPVHRGSTSVFLLAPGPLPDADDPLFSPGADALGSDAAHDACPPTTTATITAPWAPEGR